MDIDTTIKIATPGERLKYIRTLTQLSRAAVREKFKISDSTLRSWEDDKVLINESKIQKYLEAYRSIGIIASSEWIRTGKGVFPSMQDQSIENVSAEYLDLLNKHSPNFISYIDLEEKFAFINEKYQEIFSKPANLILGKTLKELIGDSNYNICKPYLMQAFSGESVTYEYPWEYEKDKYKYLKISYVPDKVNGNIVGIFSFLEYSQQIFDVEKIISSKDVDDFIPSIIENDIEYNHELFLEVIELVNKLFSDKNIKPNMETIIKISTNIYAYSFKNNELSYKYAESLIRILLNSNFFKK